MSSIATSFSMNGVMRGVAMRSAAGRRAASPASWYRIRFADNAYALFRRRSPFPLAARATIPAPRPRRTRTLRRLAIPAVAARTPNAAVDHGRRSRIYTAFAFDVDIVKVGRGWGDEVNALYTSAHRSMHRCRHRVRFAGAAAAEKQPAPIKIGRRQLCIARGKD